MIIYYGYINGNVNQITGVFPQWTLGTAFNNYEECMLLVNDEIY